MTLILQFTTAVSWLPPFDITNQIVFDGHTLVHILGNKKQVQRQLLAGLEDYKNKVHDV